MCPAKAWDKIFKEMGKYFTNRCYNSYSPSFRTRDKSGLCCMESRRIISLGGDKEVGDYYSTLSS